MTTGSRVNLTPNTAARTLLPGDVLEDDTGLRSVVTHVERRSSARLTVTISNDNRTGLPRCGVFTVKPELMVRCVGRGPLPFWVEEAGAIKVGDTVRTTLGGHDWPGVDDVRVSGRHWNHGDTGVVSSTHPGGIVTVKFSRNAHLPRHLLVNDRTAVRLIEESHRNYRATLPPPLDPGQPNQFAEVIRRLKGRMVAISGNEYGLLESIDEWNRDRARTFVLIDKDLVIGLAETTKEDDSGDIYIRRLQVANGYRRQGIGSFLFNQMTSDHLIRTNLYVNHSGQSHLGTRFWNGYTAKRPGLALYRHLGAVPSRSVQAALDCISDWPGDPAREFCTYWEQALQEDLTDRDVAGPEPGDPNGLVSLSYRGAIQHGYEAPLLV